MKQQQHACGAMMIGMTGPLLIQPTSQNDQVHQLTFRTVHADKSIIAVYLLPNHQLSASQVISVYIDDPTSEWQYRGYLNTTTTPSMQFSVYGRVNVTVRIIILPQLLFIENKTILNSINDQCVNDLELILSYNTVCMMMMNRRDKNATTSRITNVLETIQTTKSKLLNQCLQARSMARSHHSDLDRKCSDFLKNAPSSRMTTSELLDWAEQEMNAIDRLLITPYINIRDTLAATDQIRINNDKSSSDTGQIQNQIDEQLKRIQRTAKTIVAVMESIQDKSLDRIQGTLLEQEIAKRKQLNTMIKERSELLQL
jgi:hypothetical protein